MLDEKLLQDKCITDFTIALIHQWDTLLCMSALCLSPCVHVSSFRLLPTDILPVTSPFSLRALRETFSDECTRSEESWEKKLSFIMLCMTNTYGFEIYVKLYQPFLKAFTWQKQEKIIWSLRISTHSAHCAFSSASVHATCFKTHISLQNTLEVLLVPGYLPHRLFCFRNTFCIAACKWHIFVSS